MPVTKHDHAGPLDDCRGRRVWCCRCSRWATGITAYRENGGTIEHALQIACHESPKTTKLYDRTSDQITLDEVERILI
jgi:integrase/recombinase XerD